jgi:hypothetical protein
VQCRQLNRSDYCYGNALPVTVASMGQRGLTNRQAARANRRRDAGKIDLLERRTLRRGWHLRKETRSRYDRLVATGEVDRSAWAEVISDLLAEEAAPPNKKHGAKTRFAAKVGVSVRTVDTWLRQEVDVKESSVRGVADAYGRKQMDVLIQVGFYSADELPYRPTDDEIDEEQRRVLDAGLDTKLTAQLLHELDQMRADDERLIGEQRERDRQRRLREVTLRIDQARRDQ